MKLKDETRNVYDYLTVLSLSGKNKRGIYMWLCECDCGNQKIVAGNLLRNGSTRSCGCLRKQRITETLKKEEVGNVYGDLTVLSLFGKNALGAYIWLCQCKCGNQKPILGTNLRAGNTKSCGCLRKRKSSVKVKKQEGIIYIKSSKVVKKK